LLLVGFWFVGLLSLFYYFISNFTNLVGDVGPGTKKVKPVLLLGGYFGFLLDAAPKSAQL